MQGLASCYYPPRGEAKMTLKLYCFGESGHSYKVALALALLDLPHEKFFVDFFKGETRTPEFRKLNVMGECPVLVEDDEVLTQSGNILYHLVGKTGKLGGEGPKDQKEVWRWVLWDNHKMSAQVGMVRFQMNFLPEDKRNRDVIAFILARVESAYKILNDHLEGRDWIVGRGVTVADLSCCSYLYYPEAFGFERAKWPNIDRWLSNIAGLPGWKHPYDLMQRAFTA
jgi:glutathione S-transferase